jgi:hypothetical protein
VNEVPSIKSETKPPTELERYAHVVDRLGIERITAFNRTKLFGLLRPMLRAEGLSHRSNANQLAHVDYYDLLKLASKERLDVVRELRRRILHKHTSASQLPTWHKLDRLLPATKEELARAARRGLATPFIERLRRKPIPGWLRKPSTLICISKNRPQWTHRLTELLDAGVTDYSTMEWMLNNSIREGDCAMILKLIERWPTDRRFPQLADAPSLAIAEALLKKDPQCLAPEIRARIQYRNGDRKGALAMLAEMPGRTYHAYVYAEGVPDRDLGWIKACGRTKAERAEILGSLLETRKGDFSDIVVHLLRFKPWLEVIKSPDEGRYPVEMAFKSKNPVLREIIMAAVPPEVHIEFGALRHQPEFMAELLRRRPANHDEDLWKGLPLHLARRLIPLAKNFSANAALEALKLVGQSRELARHIFEQTDVTIEVFELLCYSDAVVLEALAQGRIKKESHGVLYPLEKTKLRLSTLKKLIGPKSPWGSYCKAPDAVSYQMRSACLYVLAGHKPATLAPFVAAAITNTEGISDEIPELELVLKPAIPSLTDAQIGSLLKVPKLKTDALAEVKRRAATRLLSQPVLRALLHSATPELFVEHRNREFNANERDMLRLIDLQYWDVLKAIRLERPAWQKANDHIFTRENQPHWGKLIDLGFTITTEHHLDDLLLMHIDQHLFTNEQLNQVGIYAVHQYGSTVALPKVYPAPGAVHGTVIDLYNQGKLSRRLLGQAVKEKRTYNSNLGGVHELLCRLQRQAPESRRACIIAHSQDTDRWEMLGMKPPHESLRNSNPFGFSLSGFKPIVGALLHECCRAGTDPRQILQPAFNLSVAFGNLIEVQKVLHKRNLPSKAPLHDLGQFELPSKGTWNIGGWRNMLLHHSGRGLHIVQLAPNIEARLGRVPCDIDEAERTAVLSAYAHGDKHLALAQLCFRYHLEEEKFDDYVALMKRAKTTDHCPDIKLCGQEIGRTDLVFRRVQPGDPTGPLLGTITGCCQHLHGAAEDCAVAGTIDPDATFYVLEKKSHILAQCFAWRTASSLVFDSWERLSDDYDTFCQSVLVPAAEQALGLDSTLKDVRLGTGGNTPALQLAKAKPCKWKRRLGGMDSASQYLLASREPTGAVISHQAVDAIAA